MLPLLETPRPSPRTIDFVIRKLKQMSRSQSPRVFAHRGSSEAYAEHTRAAYLHALEEGADGVETDVHLTRDGQVVCCHDFTVDATSDGTGEIAQMPLAELRALDFHSWKGVEIPEAYGARDEQFMTLSELLTLLRRAGRSVVLALELKHPDPPEPHHKELDAAVMDVLHAHGWEPSTSHIPGEDAGTWVEVSFMSFSAESLRKLIHDYPEIPRETVCAVFDQHERTLPLIEDGVTGLAGPSVPWARKHPERMREWARRGILSRVWTVDDPDDARFLRGLVALEGLTTNRPGLILRVRDED